VETGLYEGLKIIDTDTHWCESLDIWTSRAPKKYAELVPQVRENDHGGKGWFFQGKQMWPVGSTGSGSYVDSRGFKMPPWGWKKMEDDQDMLANTPPLDFVMQASWDPVARVEMMDEQGIYAEIVYPNLLLFAMGHLVRCEDRQLANACIQLYNDACAEFQAAGKGRLFPMAPLPIWDVEESIKEAERIKSMDFRGVVMPGQPQKGGLPDPADESWDPLYEALSDLDLPINIHIGANVVSDIYDEMSKPQGPSVRWQRPMMTDPRAGTGGSQLFGDNEIFIINFVMSDLALKFPNLRWVSVESGIGWIPHCLESIDFLYREKFDGYPDSPEPLVPDAFDMFRRALYACFWFERSAPEHLLEDIGVDNVLWETDFPHSTALHPNPVERAAENLKDVPREHITKIMQDNAAKLYKIPV
jgi:predicted TIM-barrel fold metal-dependent hydrolase